MGSCNRETGHVWFNLELAKKHPLCLEYIVVHEMTHLLERNHGERTPSLWIPSCLTGARVATSSMPPLLRQKTGVHNLVCKMDLGTQ